MYHYRVQKGLQNRYQTKRYEEVPVYSVFCNVFLSHIDNALDTSPGGITHWIFGAFD